MYTRSYSLFGFHKPTHFKTLSTELRIATQRIKKLKLKWNINIMHLDKPKIIKYVLENI